MRGFGAVVTFDIRGGAAAADRFCTATNLFSLAEGLGGIESLVGYPFLMSHGAFPAGEKRRKGISEDHHPAFGRNRGRGRPVR